jgi:hypothetical protein
MMTRSSKLNLFEGFSKQIVDAVKANPTLWKDTAIFITFDEAVATMTLLCAAARLLRRRHADSYDCRITVFEVRGDHA